MRKPCLRSSLNVRQAVRLLVISTLLYFGDGIANAQFDPTTIQLERVTILNRTTALDEFGNLQNNGWFSVLIGSTSTVIENTARSCLPVSGRPIWQLELFTIYKNLGLIPDWVRSDAVYRYNFQDFVIVGIAGITDPNVPVITEFDGPLPDATAQTNYAYTLSHGGGVEPFAWTIGSGALPPGILLGAATGVLSGIPSTQGASTFSIRITDGIGRYAEKVVSIEVKPPTLPTYSINTSVSPIGAGTATGGGVVAVGQAVTVVASANPGYAFVNWTESGTQVSAAISYNFAVNGNRNVVANFVAVPLQPPKQLTQFGLSNGLIRFVLNGPAASNYVIQASSNLINWSVLLTNVIPYAGWRVIDVPVPTNQLQMFYRALPQLQGPLVLQPGPVDGKDIWTTSYYSYAPGGTTPGGGLDDHKLRIGGWGDEYRGLLEFDLVGLPTNATAAVLYLYCFGQSGGGTPMYFDRITQSWNWKMQGTGRDRDRLWWVDKPTTAIWSASQLPTPISGQWYAVDVTTLYNAWRSGTYPNYGLQLRPVFTLSDNFNNFYSSDFADDPLLRPRLVITQ